MVMIAISDWRARMPHRSIILLFVFLCACSQKNISEEQKLQEYKDKPVVELLEYLHTEYGCYTTSDIYGDRHLRDASEEYSFVYCDSVEVKQVWVDPYPSAVGSGTGVNVRAAWLAKMFPLRNMKVDRIGLVRWNLQDWIAHETAAERRRLEKLRERIVREIEDER